MSLSGTGPTHSSNTPGRHPRRPPPREPASPEMPDTGLSCPTLGSVHGGTAQGPQHRYCHFYGGRDPTPKRGAALPWSALPREAEPAALGRAIAGRALGLPGLSGACHKCRSWTRSLFPTLTGDHSQESRRATGKEREDLAVQVFENAAEEAKHGQRSWEGRDSEDSDSRLSSPVSGGNALDMTVPFALSWEFFCRE